jgi:hypothetical protein
MSAPELPAAVKEAINAHMMAAASSNAFTAGVIGTGKPLAVAQPQAQVEKPKMRSGPTLGPRKAAKVSDIF